MRSADYYEYLGLSREASREAIEAGLVRKARALASAGSPAGEMHLLSRVRATLLDADARRTYDATLKTPSGSPRLRDTGGVAPAARIPPPRRAQRWPRWAKVLFYVASFGAAVWIQYDTVGVLVFWAVLLIEIPFFAWWGWLLFRGRPDL